MTTDNSPLVNRELSWLEFNRRVLEEAQDETVPLLERVRFLAIFSSNLDEYYMVRVAGLKRQIAAGDRTIGPDGLTPSETMLAVAAHAVWNALASVAITEALCGARTPDGPCAPAPDATTLFVTVPLLVLAAIGPLGLGLGWLVRREPG